MRVGVNPQKKDYKVKLESNHRIIMVIYIPELTGYYANMLEVVKVSIKSLIKTIPITSKITLVDNGSCKEVQNYLMELFKNNEIDALQLLATNIGKIDALIGAARASREPILTLTDCDILFKPSWVTKTIEIFNAFKNVSSVSPIPTRRGFNYFTYSTKLAILKKEVKLSFLPIEENFENYNLFLDSINWAKDLDNKQLWPVVSCNGKNAIVGSDHQVVTLRRDVLFNNTPKEPSYIKVGSESEQNYVDLPIDSSFGLRLSTYNYYALHMGNNLEDWMISIYKSINTKAESALELVLNPSLKYNSESVLKYKIIKKTIKKIFKIKTPQGY